MSFLGNSVGFFDFLPGSMKSTKNNYSVTAEGKTYHSRSLRRFLQHTRTIKFENGIVVTVRVNYEDGGKNEGAYTKQVDFNKALHAFLE